LSLVGQTIAGRFELLDLIGEGGYGEVYRAVQVSMDREVAIKVIHPHLAATPGVSERFSREAVVASKLTHPNSVVYFDFGEVDGLLYLAMEFVKGKALSDLLAAEGPLPVSRTAHIALQVLGALREAHNQRMVHRDLKPANILITTRAGDPDFVKVIDFGLAKIVRGPADSKPPGDGLTQTGAIMGTPAYMSPEQIRGEDLDGRCDLYALGIILYVCLTGRKPFMGGTPVETAARQLTDPIPTLRPLNPSVPETMELLVMSLLAKDREHRPADADEVAAVLAGMMDLRTPSGSGALTRLQVQRQINAATTGQQPAYQSGEIPAPSDPVLSGTLAHDQTLKYGGSNTGPMAVQPKASRTLLVLFITVFLAALGTVGLVISRQNKTDVPVETEHDGGGQVAALGPDADGASQPDDPERTAPEVSVTAPSDDVGGSEVDHLAAQRQAVTDGFQVGRETIHSALEPSLAAQRAEGEQRVEAARERERAAEREAEREAERRRSAPGTLTIQANPWGVVYCGGERWGDTPVTREVEPGSYDCVVRGPNGRIEELTAEVRSERTTRETATFN